MCIWFVPLPRPPPLCASKAGCCQMVTGLFRDTRVRARRHMTVLVWNPDEDRNTPWAKVSHRSSQCLKWELIPPLRWSWIWPVVWTDTCLQLITLPFVTLFSDGLATLRYPWRNLGTCSCRVFCFLKLHPKLKTSCIRTDLASPPSSEKHHMITPQMMLGQRWPCWLLTALKVFTVCSLQFSFKSVEPWVFHHLCQVFQQIGSLISLLSWWWSS